jgi:hypothetical protein
LVPISLNTIMNNKKSKICTNQLSLTAPLQLPPSSPPPAMPQVEEYPAIFESEDAVPFTLEWESSTQFCFCEEENQLDTLVATLYLKDGTTKRIIVYTLFISDC